MFFKIFGINSENRADPIGVELYGCGREYQRDHQKSVEELIIEKKIGKSPKKC